MNDDTNTAEIGRGMTQTGRFPVELQEVVDRLLYKPDWNFVLEEVDRGQGSAGLTLTITIRTLDSYHPEQRRGVDHYFIVPAAAYDTRSWRRWVFDRIVDVETHEAMEFFQLHRACDCPVPTLTENQDDHAIICSSNITDRPYAPSHGPGNDPYIVREIGTDVDQRTSFRGDLAPPRDDAAAGGGSLRLEEPSAAASLSDGAAVRPLTTGAHVPSGSDTAAPSTHTTITITISDPDDPKAVAAAIGRQLVKDSWR